MANRFLGTLEQRMDNKSEFNEKGELDIGDPEVMLPRFREWYAEHVRILTELGIPVANEPELDPSDVGEDLPPDFNDY